MDKDLSDIVFQNRNQGDSYSIHFGNSVVYDYSRNILLYEDGSTSSLTRNERQLLHKLAMNIGFIVENDSIFRFFLGHDYTIKQKLPDIGNLVSRLNSKIGGAQKYIENNRGIGYRLIDAEVRKHTAESIESNGSGFTEPREPQKIYFEEQGKTTKRNDCNRLTVTDGNSEVSLTPNEQKILVQLAYTPNVFITTETLLENIWGPENISNSYLMHVHVNRLKKKLGNSANCIISKAGVGYMLSEVIVEY